MGWLGAHLASHGIITIIFTPTNRYSFDPRIWASGHKGALTQLEIENEKATPTLSSLERLANALEVTVPELLAGGCSREREIRDLMADECIAELVPYITKLNGMQWSSLLTQMRDLVTRPQRTS